MTNIENTIDRIRELIETDDNNLLREELETYHSADLADIFQELKPEERLACITNINEELASDVIEYLPPQLRVEILGDIDEKLASRLVSKLPHDDAADVFQMHIGATSVFMPSTVSSSIAMRIAAPISAASSACVSSSARIRA